MTRQKRNSSLDRCRILIVDPFGEDASPMRDVFRSGSKFDVQWAVDLNSAAHIIDTGTINVVISEFCLPNGTAADLCRNTFTTSTVSRFFVYSPIDREIDRSQAILSGASDFFVIPDELLRLERATYDSLDYLDPNRELSKD